MSDDARSPIGDPTDPGRITDREGFARALTVLRERQGLTVRQVAARTASAVPYSTVGTWFSGKGLPSLALREIFLDVLRGCGVRDSRHLHEWLLAWERVRRVPGRRPAAASPYPGLAAFTAEDAERFFGRARLIEELVRRLARADECGTGRLLVVGPSGAGKSSVLAAGLVPALRSGALPGSADWNTEVVTPASHPLPLLSELRQTSSGPRLVLIVDQFEELFTPGKASAYQTDYISALFAMATGPDRVLVIIGLRADLYGPALTFPEIRAVAQDHQVTVGPMSREELQAAIVGPARLARIEIEEGLAELLIHQMGPAHSVASVHDPGTLPLLAHALYATWQNSQGRRLRIADYHRSGGIDVAIDTTATAVYNGLDQAEREVARRLFLGLVHVGDDTMDSRRRMPLADLDQLAGPECEVDVQKVLTGFVAQRLVTVDANVVQLSHEAVITAWPQLREWLDADRASLLVGRRLSAAAESWHRDGRQTEGLYRQSQLAAGF